jgi:uncharacterized membrane protein
MNNYSARRSLLRLVGAIVSVLFLPQGIVRAEEIRDFSVDISIRQDATISVTETIRYDFGELERHGIYRDIPYRYSTDVGSYSAALDNITVVDEAGNPYLFETSRGGGMVHLKIGDSDTTISGEHTYRITYDVAGAISYFADFDELYWNATGDNWQVPIQHVQGTARFEDFAPEILQASCYRGARGSGEQCEGSTIHDDIATLTFAEAGLAPSEGVTIALAIPKGFIYEPTPVEQLLKTIRDNGIVALPLLVALLMWRLWYKRGRDPRGRNTIIAEFDAPAGMSPIEVGGLVDENVHPKDITAEIVHLAVSGYLKVHQIEVKKLLVFPDTDYVLEKLKDESTLQSEFDRTIIKALFAETYVSEHDVNGTKIQGVALSDLKNKLHTDMRDVNKRVYEALVAKGYFPINPQRVRTTYVVAGVLVAVVGIILSGVTGLFATPLAIGSSIASGVVVLIFAAFMPKKTAQGVAAREHALGLKRYLSVAEKDRLAFHNAPERTPERFDALLPYAMVFGVEKAWAKQFEDIYKDRNAPGWYSAPPGHLFMPVAFASDLSDNFASAVSAASAPQGGSGSGGGGFSGGGFGGGGGGSW